MAFPQFGRVLRDCHVGRWPPRNDKSEAFAILTVACTDCKCVAGPGCPLPALHKRFAQAAVKMVTAPTGPVAALSERPVGSNSTAGGHWCTSRSPDVSLRGAKRRGNLAVHSRIVGKPSAKTQLPSRDCHVGRWPPRNDKSEAGAILTIACSGRQHCAGRGMPRPYDWLVIKCPSAAWPRTGFPYYCKGSKSSAPCLHSGQI